MLERLTLLSLAQNNEKGSLISKKYISTILPAFLSTFLLCNGAESKISIAKLIINIQSCISNKEDKEMYAECIVSLFSRALSKNRANIPMRLQTIVGKYLITTAIIHPNFKKLVSSMSNCRKSALRACMTAISSTNN